MKYPIRRVASAVTASILGASMAASVNAADSISAQLTPMTTEAESQLPTRYIVRYKKNTANSMMKASGKMGFNAQAAEHALKARGATIKQRINSQYAVAAMLTKADVHALRQDSSVAAVELDVPRKPMAIYNDDAGDPNTSQLTPYAIYQSQANQLTLQPGQKVCVIDSGIAGSNGETGGKNNDFVWSNITGTNDSGTGNWNADGGPHGTHVAGTVGAADNGFGVVGMAPGVPMHIVKVFNNSGWGYSSDLAKAAEVCTNAGANIITMSLGGGASNTTERNAFDTFTANGGLVLAAAGNDGNSVRSYPAGYDSVMMIGANDGDNNIADFSQFPSCNTAKTNCVEATAGGVNTLSTYPSGGATVAGLSADGTGYASAAMENTGSVQGSTYFMGTAESTDNGANGKICVIDRGNISFHDKVQNCENSGGIGAVIVNNVDGVLQGTLGTSNNTSIPAVGADLADRSAIVGASSASISVGAGDYGLMSGTSMATPGVAGVAALVWSNHPSCTGTEIRNVLKVTAEDAGAAGHDVYFGNGIVKAKNASDWIAANGCDGSGGNSNQPPVASFTNSCTDLSCTFNGSGSSDSDGTIASYAWNFGDGNTASGANASHTYSAAGTYSVALTVTDNDGSSNTSTQSVTVTEPDPGNTLPTASFTNSCTDLACSFDGSGSTDSDGSIASYAWNFGDGSTASGATANHTYAAAGTYSVQLTVTDNMGGTNSSSQSVTVTAGDNGDNVLTNGVAKTGLSAGTGEQIAYTMDVPAGATDLSFVMSGGTGDADLYVKFGSAATTSSYDCRPYKSGNAETCSFATPQAGTYYVMINGYSAFSSVSLTGSFTEDTGSNDTVLENGVTKTNIGSASSVMYTMEVPAGATDLSFAMSGGSGDADMYVKFGSAPTSSSYDCRPYKSGNSETCSFSAPQAGTYYIMLNAYSTFSGVTLTGSYTEGNGGGGNNGGSSSLTDLEGAQGAWSHYTLEIPAGMSSLNVVMSGGTGDADLYVREGSQPTTSAYDCRPYKNGNEETCTISNPGAGTWYISIRGYRAYTGVSLNATWAP